MDYKTEGSIRQIERHLDDIARSLRIISGRESAPEAVAVRKESYKDSYFKRTEPERGSFNTIDLDQVDYIPK